MFLINGLVFLQISLMRSLLLFCLFVYSYQYPGKILVNVCLYLIVFVCRVYDRMTVVCLYILTNILIKNLLLFVCLCRVYDRMTVACLFMSGVWSYDSVCKIIISNSFPDNHASSNNKNEMQSSLAIRLGYRPHVSRICVRKLVITIKFGERKTFHLFLSFGWLTIC